jgi:glycosyltransferase involved in cell wall biosynthesis
MKNPTGTGVAVLIPCYNEARTIAAVVRDFRRALPEAAILVFDNRSSDATTAEALAAGAVVRTVSHRGKGNVVRRMFADVEAEVYLMVDGDGTYDATAAGELVKTLVEGGLDMVVGSRVSEHADAYRPGHRLGNAMLTGTVAFLFGDRFSDMLSGYRVFSRRYAKSFPAAATGFEIETELTVHALQLHMPTAEVPTRYGSRPEGSESKLNTWRDGWRILYTIGRLFKNERPLMFFSLGFAASSLVSILLAIPLFGEYLRTGLVPRFPTAILCTGLILLGMILLACGLVLDTVTRGRIEAKRLAYLAVPGPAPHRP